MVLIDIMDMNLNTINIDKYDKNSLPNNYIVDIIEDKNGYIWVSTIAGTKSE